MKIDKQLQRYCKERGLSITTLAKRSGISVQTLHNWSIGKPATSFEYARSVAQVLNVPLYELIFGEPDPQLETREQDHRGLFDGQAHLATLQIDEDSIIIRIDRNRPVP